MGIIVQKYGGSSLAGAERIRSVARRIARSAGGGDQVVVVASAMGDTTDYLIHLAQQVSDEPDPRELDLLLSTGETVSCTLLALALRHLGVRAISLTGAQAGIRTDTAHRRARILAIEPTRLIKELRKGQVVIVAGFQGITDQLDITTLGRGGSDITAVALAARLRAKTCQIYTDVPGIFTADPRLAPEARQLPEISYEEMLELATYGAQVMHPRAVELAGVYRIPILVASSFEEVPGTLMRGPFLEETPVAPREGDMELLNKVRGIAADTDVAKITVIGVPDRPGIAAALFEPLAEAGISVDCIVQNSSINRIADLSFTVSQGNLKQAFRLVEPVARSLGATQVLSDSNLAKVSIVGAGIQSAPGYAARMFRTLAAEKINIELITTSEIRITCLIGAQRMQDAVRALHLAFGLGEEQKALRPD